LTLDNCPSYQINEELNFLVFLDLLFNILFDLDILEQNGDLKTTVVTRDREKIKSTDFFL